MAISISADRKYSALLSNNGSNSKASKQPSIYDVFPRSPGQGGAPKASNPPSTNQPQPEIATNGFMASLKAKLSETTDDPESYLRSQSMLSALKAGKLTVTDATQGKEIMAWDKDSKAKPTKADNISKSDWTTFLNDHLKRDNHGAFQKTADGSYVDKHPDEKAYFGRVAGKYYYVTWPSDKTST
ncbi:hypothetical protein [Rhizobium sp. BR 314]|uniref:hypothetical protein n=1 Tax=Rhizobium sp. BR 314 TaxID=3040013 RepID=UPI0039BF5F09